MTDTVDAEYPLTMRDKKALLASEVEVRSFLVEEPTWTSPVDATSGTRTSAVFRNPFKQNVHELVMLEPDGTLVHLAHSPESTTGWGRRAFAGTYTQLVTTMHPDGTAWMFAIGVVDKVEAMWSFQLEEERGWVSGPYTELTGTEQLYAGYGQDGAPRVWLLWGVGAWIDEVQPVLATSPSVPQQPSWTVVKTGVAMSESQNVRDWVVGYVFEHLAVYALGTWDQTHQDRTELVRYLFRDGKADIANITNDVLALAGRFADRYITGPDVGILGAVFLAKDGKAKLAHFELAADIIPCDNTWRSLHAHPDQNGNLVLVGVVADGSVRVMRETGAHWAEGYFAVPDFAPFGSSSAGMTFAVSPATSDTVTVVVDASPTDVVALVGVARAGSVPVATTMYTHDLRFGWRQEPMSLAATIGLDHECLVTHFVADAYVRNAIGAPMQVVPVGLSADIPIQVEVQGQWLVLGPDATVSTWTDAFGKVTFRLAASSLDLPMIHLTALGLGQGASVNAAECVQDFLGGDAAIASVPEGMNPTSLGAARVNGRSLIDWAAAPLDAKHVVAECQRAFARPSYEQQSPSIDADRDLPVRRSSRSSSGYSTNASQDDLLQSFRCGATSIHQLSFAVDSGKASVWIGHVGTSLEVPLELDAAEYSPRVLECLFWWLGASIPNLMTWMTSTIDFTQMWNTVKALEEMSVGTSEWQAAAAKYFGSKIKPKVFDDALTKLTDGLATVRNQVGERSVPQLLLPFSGAPGHGERSPGTLAAGLDLAELIDSPHGRWIFDRVLYSTAGAQPPDLPDTMNIAPPVTQILREFSSGELWDDYKKALPDLAAPWNVTDPSSFHLDAAEMGLSSLDSLVAPALSSCEEVSTAIVAALGKSMDVLTQVTSSPAGAGPELDAIFAWLQLRAGVPSKDLVPLTVLRMGFLVVAVPVNLACQRALGAYPFPDGVAPKIPLPPGGAAQVGASVPLQVALTFQIAAAATQLVWVWMNTAIDFLPLMLTGCVASFFPGLGDPERVMRLFVGFEFVAFVVIGNPWFWGYSMPSGWWLTEEVGWWLQYIVQSFFILLDAVTVFFGHLIPIPGLKRVILGLEGRLGAILMTTYSIVLLGLAGLTFGLSEKVTSDFLWLLNRLAVYLPGILGYLRYMVIEFLENQPGQTKVVYGRPTIWVNIKVFGTIGANLVGAATEFYFPLAEILNPPGLPPLTLPRGHLNQAYKQGTPFAPRGGFAPYSGWTVVSGRIPNGTELAPSEDGLACVLAGTPNEVGQFTFDLAVTDYFAPGVTVQQSFSLNVTETADSLV